MNKNVISSETVAQLEVSKADENAREFELTQRKAMVYAKSTLVPDHYKNNVSNVMIAMNMANRLNADILMVMQNLYIVHGKPAWSAQFMIACFNSSHQYSAIKYRLNELKTECVAYCTELKTGDLIESPTISLAMAKAEKWSTKNGSKWQNLSELMLRYRAATFLIRTTAPQITMGLQTRSEVEDTFHDIAKDETIEGKVVRNLTSLNSAMNSISKAEDEAKEDFQAALQEAERSAEATDEVMRANGHDPANLFEDRAKE
tara:strand:- start:1368 stop:2147 length:780 start_codon:yes stop_codon:yes gene_type:complete